VRQRGVDELFKIGAAVAEAAVGAGIGFIMARL